MAGKPQRYKVMERFMTVALCVNAILFIFYLIAAGNGIIWLKVILTLLCFGISGLMLWFLYATKELLRQRSLWITTGAAAIAVCLLFSLLLNFPSPNKYKPKEEKSACVIVAQL